MTETATITERLAAEEFLATRSEESFIALFELVYPKVMCFFLVRGVQRTTAEELAQDVLTSVYRHASTLREPQFFFAWLFRIARNNLFQYLRKHRREKHTISIDEMDSDTSREIQVDGGAVNLELCDWLRCLESEERQIMMLRYVEELGYQEIATVLGIPLGTVKWKIFDAKSKLAGILKGK